MKSKCHCCKKKIGVLGIHCSYCQGTYCTGCIVLEKHNCTGMEKYNEKNKNVLKNILESSTFSKKEKLLPGFE